MTFLEDSGEREDILEDPIHLFNSAHLLGQG